MSCNKRPRPQGPGVGWSLKKGSTAGFFVFLGALLFLNIRTSVAHIIPPEKLDPVAASYRNATFILNLNPVVWEQVWPEMEVIANHLRRLDSKRCAVFSDAIAAARKIALPPSQRAEKPDPVQAREEGRRAVFTAATRAVAGLVIRHLELASEATESHKRGRHLQLARQIFDAFAEVLPHHDPTAWKRLGVHWLAASSQLGTRGILGAGAKPPDTAALKAEVGPIIRYLTANYLGFRAGEERRLSARPKTSPTYDPSARLPIRLPPAADINKQVPRPRQILGMAARGVDESETSLIALGDMAFDSSHIFGEPARSLGINCNTCHNKGVTNPGFFIPGLSKRPGGFDVTNSFFAGHANNGVFERTDIPDLRGIRFTAPYGRDGRFASLRGFVRNVIVHEFNGPEPDPLLVDGLIAYMNQFEFLPNTYLERGGRLSGKASKAAVRGEKIFQRKFSQMGERSCADCHIPSAHFLDHKRHDIGSLKGSGRYARDGALDTPTLLGAKFTAPYFHDGSLPTLRSVVTWFNNEYRLELGRQEVDDLTTYLETVGDGVEAYEGTRYYLEAEMEEFGFFLSTYEYLKRIEKRELMDLTFQTIATEMRNHKWELQGPEYRPVMEELAALMDEAYRLNRARRYERVDTKVAEYRRLFERNAENLK